MFKKLLNVKGEVITALFASMIAIQFAYMGIAATMGVASVLLTPSFRQRKAVEQCVSEGVKNEDECKGIVANMTPEEILDYIRDDEVPKVTQNF